MLPASLYWHTNISATLHCRNLLERGRADSKASSAISYRPIALEAVG